MDPRRALVVLAFASLAACSRGDVTGQGGTPCPANVQTDSAAHLVAPAAGAVGVPTTIGSIAFAVSLPPLRTGVVVVQPLVQGAGGIALSGIMTDANGTSHVAVPTLVAATMYRVTVSSAAGACGPFASADLGTFTTQ